MYPSVYIDRSAMDEHLLQDRSNHINCDNVKVLAAIIQNHARLIQELLQNIKNPRINGKGRYELSSTNFTRLSVYINTYNIEMNAAYRSHESGK